MAEQSKNSVVYKKSSKGGAAKSDKKEKKEKTTKIPVESNIKKDDDIDSIIQSLERTSMNRRSTRKKNKPDTYKPPAETKKAKTQMSITRVMMYIEKIRNGELDVNDPSNKTKVDNLHDSLKKHIKSINDSCNKCEEHKEYKRQFMSTIAMLDKTNKSVKSSATKRKKSPSPSLSVSSVEESLINRLKLLNKTDNSVKSLASMRKNSKSASKSSLSDDSVLNRLNILDETDNSVKSSASTKKKSSSVSVDDLIDKIGVLNTSDAPAKKKRKLPPSLQISKNN